MTKLQLIQSLKDDLGVYVEEILDEIVFDAICNEASKINNSGITGQINYLVDVAGFDPEEIIEMCRKQINAQEDFSTDEQGID